MLVKAHCVPPPTSHLCLTSLPTPLLPTSPTHPPNLQSHIDTRRAGQAQWEEENRSLREAQSALVAARSAAATARAAAESATAAAAEARALLKIPVVPACVEVRAPAAGQYGGGTLVVRSLAQLLRYKEERTSERRFEVGGTSLLGGTYNKSVRY